ncbi:MAG: hypothetical protein CMN73_15000 [Sphingomonas sp.]|nr:hypothetical protein [Sphingomonas sp.]|tara:strand:+ start:2359 stop:3183 length:825 start_codon:yes stop_codon:yes gene_type:complete
MVRMSAVWDRTAEFLSDNLTLIVPVAVIAFFVPASIEGSLPNAAQVQGALAILLPLANLFFAVVSLWGALTVVAMAAHPAEMQGAGGVARDRLIPALIVWVALFALLILLLLPVPLALMLNGYDVAALARMEEVHLTAAMAWPIAIYWFLVAAVTLWAAARCILVSPLIVLEKRMFDAIPQSIRMTRGRTWQIIGVMLLFALVAIVSMLAARVVFGSIFQLIAGGDPGPITLAGVLTSVTVAAVQTAFSVIWPAFAAKLYLALTSAASREHQVT